MKMKNLIKKTFTTVIFAASIGLIFYNFFFLSRDLIYGDGSGERVIPKPALAFFRVTDKENTVRHNAVNRLAGDYAQVYFPSQDLSSLSTHYDTGYLDPWERASRYAPAVHFLCSVSFCNLDYGYASFLHLLTQTALFYSLFIVAFKMLKIETDLTLGLFLISLLLFATPAGLSWFERGQFSLYVTMSYMLLLMGLLKNKPLLIFLSSLFAYIKWTSFPFLFTVFAVFLLSARNKKEAVRGILLGLMYLLPPLLLSLAFRSRLWHFLRGVYWQERFISPEGISLSQILPEAFVKFMPLFLILFGYLVLYKNGKSFANLIPYFIGIGILSLTYPTIAFEYSIPCVFGMIPLMFYWTKHKTVTGQIVSWGFILFLFLISWPNYLSRFVSQNIVVWGYLVVSILFLAFSLLHTQEFLSMPRLNTVKFKA